MDDTPILPDEATAHTTEQQTQLLQSPADAATATQRHRDEAVAAATSRRGSRRYLRWGFFAVPVVVVAVAGVGVHSWRTTAALEQRLTEAQARVAELESGLRGLSEHTTTRSEVEAISEARVNAAIEGGSVAPVVAQVVQSVALIQGRYVLVDPRSTHPLRMAMLNGAPQHLPDGSPKLTPSGHGPVYSPLFTGTAFVVDGSGTLLTNRHVALPWEHGPSAQAIAKFGVRPVLVELRGFLPGTASSFDVTVKGMSSIHDLALLQGTGAALTAPPLRMAKLNPAPGDAALVLGYPTGLSALLARADDEFVARLGRQPGMDDQHAADALAQAGLIQPLVSRGIVAQVSNTAVVYDAQTTVGGSGGPVLNLRGEVLAITRAVLAGFGGSNLGVPVVVAREMLQVADQHEKRKAQAAAQADETDRAQRADSATQ